MPLTRIGARRPRRNQRVFRRKPMGSPGRLDRGWYEFMKAVDGMIGTYKNLIHL